MQLRPVRLVLTEDDMPTSAYCGQSKGNLQSCLMRIDQSLSEVWLYGKGGFAKKLAEFLDRQGVNVCGFFGFEDLSDAVLVSYIQSQISSDCPVVLGVFNHVDDPKEIVADLNSVGFSSVISPAQLLLRFPECLFSQYFLSTNPPHMQATNLKKRVFSNLSDDHSRDVLRGMNDYQENGNLESICRSGTADEQYLGLTLPPSFSERWMQGNISLLDVGAFDGDTLRAFVEARGVQSGDEYLCIEPDKHSFERLLKNVSDMTAQVRCQCVGIGEEDGLVTFSHSGSLSSSTNPLISDDTYDENQILMHTLNSVCEDFSPTHIKMDIEGAEGAAIASGIDALQRLRPKLAISIYHTPYDMLLIPAKLMSYLPEYSWFIRCYGAHAYDTIIYGIPN